MRIVTDDVGGDNGIMMFMLMMFMLIAKLLIRWKSMKMPATSQGTKIAPPNPVR